MAARLGEIVLEKERAPDGVVLPRGLRLPSRLYCGRGVPDSSEALGLTSEYGTRAKNLLSVNERCQGFSANLRFQPRRRKGNAEVAGQDCQVEQVEFDLLS